MAKPAINQTFNISLGDGGKHISGEIAIDSEGKVSKKIVSASEPLPLEFYEDIIKLIRDVTNLEIKYNGIKTIEFKSI